MKNNKVYSVQIGKIDHKTDFQNFYTKIVVASDVLSALKKVKLDKNYYYAECQILVSSNEEIS